MNEKSHDLISWERIGTESNRSTWNNGGLFIHKLRPLCASYPLEYYPSDDSAIGLSVRPTFTDARLERFGLRLRLRLFLCNISSYCRAAMQTRTVNLLLTGQAFYRLNYSGLAGRFALGRIFRCYGSFCAFEKRIFVTQRTPQLKLCKLMVRLELTITVLQTVPLTSWVHEQAPPIAAAVHDSLLWNSYGGMGEVGLEPTVFLRE